MKTIDELRRAVAYGTEKGHGTLIVPLDLLRQLLQSTDALAEFKAYVHRRLDEAGVPADPDSPHKAEGCRIGGRLDIVLSRSAPVADAAPASEARIASQRRRRRGTR